MGRNPSRIAGLTLAAGLLLHGATARAERGHGQPGGAASAAVASYTAELPSGASGSASLAIHVGAWTGSELSAELHARQRGGGAAALALALAAHDQGTLRVAGGPLLRILYAHRAVLETGTLAQLIAESPSGLPEGSELQHGPDAEAWSGSELLAIELAVDASGTGQGSIAPASAVILNDDGSVEVAASARPKLRLRALRQTQ